MPKQQRRRLSGRRAHRKSRNGCRECKNRHIKCDETRPECRNCVISDLICPYLTTTPSTPSAADTASTPTNVVDNNLLAAPREIDDVALHSGPTFTATHMVFLHYAMMNMSDFMALQARAQPVIDAALENSYNAPYLLDQVLALSALHLSTQDVVQASSFRRQATELQTRALGLFNKAKDHISEDTYMPTFLFASLLGLHVLHETLGQRHDTLAEFVDHFVSYLRLHRGVRAITAKYWHHILHSDLQPLMHIAVIFEQTESEASGEDTKHLREFLESSSTSSTATEACLSALDRIQWVLDMTKQEPSRSDIGPHAVMAWPQVIPDKYIEALYEHRPEALVVLAFYGAILHRYREFWVFGHSGSFLIYLVARTVGSFWQYALAWPLQSLRDI
ncbi:Upc2 protein [Fusarium redolens]|uniref:Upc2 protein n=1 Tax=Fusarium redolens TaxID=48865 RepID=A0A9P9GCH8_FUSRE|nr:Upc2 protein [Fusarium redolens]KAH7237003.1 Upc2 protein [Fusarium redolens]